MFFLFPLLMVSAILGIICAMIWYHKTGGNGMKSLARGAFVAALYALLVVLPPFASFAYGPIQVRIAEALTVLPYLFPETVWGLTLGCFVANVLGGLGFWDFSLGTLCTFLAAFWTSRTRHPLLAPLPPVLVNGFGVAAYLAFLFKVPYGVTASYILLGEAVACYGLGYPLLVALLKRGFRKE
uniref:QueT transporter family protein n=1 Tax=Candidatus Caldatribacterium californiense TaxID=1454726 RepID=A0A7V3YK41_9BACT